MDFKEKERNLQKQIEISKEQSEAKNQQLADLEGKLSEYEKSKKIEIEKIEIQCKRLLKAERDKRQKMMLQHSNETRIMATLIHKQGAILAYEDEGPTEP